MPRLLLIEDNDALRATLVIALTDAGHSVVEAGDGRQGANIVRAEPIDLVITDLVMPDQEGIETIQSLRRLRPNLPVIAISGNSPFSSHYLAMAGRLGAQRTLSKPFTADELLRAIEALLPPPSDAPAAP